MSGKDARRELRGQNHSVLAGSRWSRPPERCSSARWSAWRVVKARMDRASVTNPGSAALVQSSWAVTQPPGNTVYQVATRPEGPWSVGSKRWAPGWSEGRWMVAVVSQVALSRTTRDPTRYLRRVNIDHPFLAADGLVSSGRFTNLQPAGNDGTHGQRQGHPLRPRPTMSSSGRRSSPSCPTSSGPSTLLPGGGGDELAAPAGRPRGLERRPGSPPG